MLEDRRKFPRVDVKYSVNIICEGTVIIGEPRDYTFHTYTENLSEGGVKVILEQRLKISSLVQLELFIGDKKTPPIKCKGSVVWVDKINPDGTKPDLFATGIQFVDFRSHIDQESIGNLVRHFLGKKD